MNISKTIKSIRLKIFKWLLDKCFKPEIKENIMRKYYVSYMLVMNNGNMPIYADTYVNVESGILDNTQLDQLKKDIISAFFKKNSMMPGFANNARVVFLCINDVTKEEITKAVEHKESVENKEQSFDKNFFMKGTVEVVNGKKYVDGVLQEE